MFKILYGREEYLENIIISDLQSEDNTREILKKLSKDYDTIKFLNWKDCKDLIDNIIN